MKLLFKKASLLALTFVLFFTFINTDVFANQMTDEVPVPVPVQADEFYPINVEEITDDNGFKVIIRTYALSPNEVPNNIPRGDFEKYGERFIFSEIIKKENLSNNQINHVETVTINTSSNSIDKIISQLESQIVYEKDGFEGTLDLDISTLKTTASGYKTSTSSLKTTREYPNLSNNDSSSIPKSVSQGGKSYNLIDVNFKPDGTTMIDYEEIPTTYKAIATYSTTTKNSSVTGYVTTASYNGMLSKTLIDTVIYKVYFLSENQEKDMNFNNDKNIEDENNLLDLDNEINDESLEDTNPKDDKNIDKSSIFKSRLSPLVIVLLSMLTVVLLILGGIGGAMLVTMQNSVTIFNYNEDENNYLKIVKVNMKKSKIFIDLNKYHKKISTPIFVISLSKKLTENLIKKKKESIELVIKYRKDKISKHIDLLDEFENEFEIDFSKIEELSFEEGIDIEEGADIEEGLYVEEGIDTEL